MTAETAVVPERTNTSDLAAPLYVAWQITNECNLACLHCIEESGPGKAFKDELTTEQAYGVIDQLVKSEVPYVSFSGGEPMVRPDFFGMVERITKGGVGLKIETRPDSICSLGLVQVPAQEDPETVEWVMNEHYSW